MLKRLFKALTRSPVVSLLGPLPSGILHHLLAVTDMDSLMTNPRLGASWEGFAIEQIIRILPLRDVYFWSTYSGAELDLLFFITAKDTALKSNSVKPRKSPNPCTLPYRILIWNICG